MRDRRVNIGVLGAGGLGACLAGQMIEAGTGVTLVARGTHGQQITTHGLELKDSSGTRIVGVPVVPRLQDLPKVDVLFVTVKAFSLDALMPELLEFASTGGLTVPLLNGVDHLDRLERWGVPRCAVAGGIAYLTGFRRGPGRVERIGAHGRILLGPRRDCSRKRLSALAKLLKESGLDAEVSTEIETHLWRKMGVVCTLSAVCVLFDGNLGRVRAHPYGRSSIRRAAAEVTEVAALRGVPLPEGEVDRITALVDQFDEDFYPSLLHDLRSGRPTEIDSLNGALARWARASGSEAPLHEAAAAAVAARPSA